MPEEKKSVDLLRKELTTKDRAALKRCCGKSMCDCLDALGVYYSVKPHMVAQWCEERHFTAVTLSCLWRDNERGRILPLAVCLQMIRQSESLDHRVLSLLDIDWDDSSDFFQGKLMRLVKLVRSRLSGASPDFAQLFRDLCRWNNPERAVQKQWARSYFAASDTKTE